MQGEFGLGRGNPQTPLVDSEGSIDCNYIKEVNRSVLHVVDEAQCNSWTPISANEPDYA